MAFLKRASDREVRHLEWRIRIFGSGAILAVLGMYFDMSWMIWLAIVVLVLGLGLRFLPGSGGGEEGARVEPGAGPDEVGAGGEETSRE